MYQSNPRFDNLHRKSVPGFSFTQSERNLTYPQSPQYINDTNMSYHFASKTEKIYSPFQNKYYLPPHLNSSKFYGNIFKGECKAWEIRSPNSSRMHMSGKQKQNMTKKKIGQERNAWNWTSNYDVQYRTYENRIKTLPGKDYHLIEPRIKYLIDQDKPSKPAKLVHQSQEEDQKQDVAASTLHY